MNIKRKCAHLVLLVLLLFAFRYECTGQAEDKDYLDLLDKRLYIEYANLKMEIFKNGKIVNYYDMESFRQGDKMRIEFLDPATERGRKMLNDESNMWMYLPRTSKIMKLPSKQSFMGSDASNRDLMRISFKKDYDIVATKEKEDNTVELELKAKDLSVSYNKIILTVDTSKMVPVKQEMYSLSNKLIKTMVYENPTIQEGVHMPFVYIIEDALQKDTKTILTYKSMNRDSRKPKEFFTLGALKKQ